MSNSVQTFTVTIKNIPYTDEQWRGQSAWRQDASKRHFHLYVKAHPEKYRPLTSRPNTPRKYGGHHSSHEEARRVCEEALRNGAQQAGYAVWNGNRHTESWEIRRPSKRHRRMLAEGKPVPDRYAGVWVCRYRAGV
ncbi:hypothetical protein C4565_08355 [Candidatus Parcubacteria bacterium]|nr:MAG: hypothetical protein C4565_08355 [Candidatus Parcubacteria bacterium]